MEIISNEKMNELLRATEELTEIKIKIADLKVAIAAKEADRREILIKLADNAKRQIVNIEAQNAIIKELIAHLI